MKVLGLAGMLAFTSFVASIARAQMGEKPMTAQDLKERLREIGNPRFGVGVSIAHDPDQAEAWDDMGQLLHDETEDGRQVPDHPEQRLLEVDEYQSAVQDGPAFSVRGTVPMPFADPDESDLEVVDEQLDVHYAERAVERELNLYQGSEGRICECAIEAEQIEQYAGKYAWVYSDDCSTVVVVDDQQDSDDWRPCNCELCCDAFWRREGDVLESDSAAEEDDDWWAFSWRVIERFGCDEDEDRWALDGLSVPLASELPGGERHDHRRGHYERSFARRCGLVPEGDWWMKFLQRPRFPADWRHRQHGPAEKQQFLAELQSPTPSSEDWKYQYLNWWRMTASMEVRHPHAFRHEAMQCDFCQQALPAGREFLNVLGRTMLPGDIVTVGTGIGHRVAAVA